MNENKETNNIKYNRIDLEQGHYSEKPRERDWRGESSEGMTILAQ
jgi:hypothetical protein